MTEGVNEGSNSIYTGRFQKKKRERGRWGGGTEKGGGGGGGGEQGWGPHRSDLLTKVWGGSLGTLTSDRAGEREKKREGEK